MLLKIVHLANCEEEKTLIILIMTISKEKGIDYADVVDSKINQFLIHSAKLTKSLKP